MRRWRQGCPQRRRASGSAGWKHRLLVPWRRRAWALGFTAGFCHWHRFLDWHEHILHPV